MAGIEFSPDGKYLAGGSGDVGATIWDAVTGEEVLILHDTSPIVDVAFGQDGRILATAGESGLTGNLTRLVSRELWSRIGHLLAALPASQREPLRLRYAEELSRAEIAYVLDIPESVVKSRLFEGLKKLREHTSLLDDH